MEGTGTDNEISILIFPSVFSCGNNSNNTTTAAAATSCAATTAFLCVESDGCIHFAALPHTGPPLGGCKCQLFVTITIVRVLFESFVQKSAFSGLFPFQCETIFSNRRGGGGLHQALQSPNAITRHVIAMMMMRH